MNIFEQIEQNLTSNKSFLGQISLDEPMAQKTTFKIGGIAKLYICPQNYYSFQLALEEILRSKQKFFILGGGSNIVFTDGIYDGIILSTKLFSDIQDFPPQDFSPDFGKIQIQVALNSAMLSENFYPNNCIEMYLINNIMNKLILISDLEPKFSLVTYESQTNSVWPPTGLALIVGFLVC